MSVIVDTFMMNDELDMLECRLVELSDVVDRFVIVESDRTHGHNRPKPLHFLENQDRFGPWSDQIVHVTATGLPSDVDAWSREHAQREFVREGLNRLDLHADDIVLHGDIDEIPDSFCVDHCRPSGFVVFDQTLCCFAVDWLHPQVWAGTVAGRVRHIDSFAKMRDARLSSSTHLPDAGWHLSWLGGLDAATRKIDSFCHPEIEDEWRPRLAECFTDGIHVDGTKLVPVDVDESWPAWIVDGKAPESWFRPR